MTTIIGCTSRCCDQEVEPRCDVERVDEGGARIPGRAVQEVDDREAPVAVPAVRGREIDERVLAAPAECRAVECERFDPALDRGLHRCDGRPEAAVEDVVVDVAGEREQAGRGDERRHRDHREALPPEPGRMCGRQRRHGLSIPPARAGRRTRSAGPAAAPAPPIGRCRGRRRGASNYDRPVSRFSVIVADDHPLFREGVVRAVRAWPELEVVAEVSNGREALERIRELTPDVACVDLRLPEIDGIGIAHAVSRDGLATRVLLLSAFADDELVYRALEAGAAGYLTKDANQEEIARAVHGVASGHTQLAPELAAGLANQIRARSHGDTPILTERERQVLELLCEGLSAPQIAARLFLGTTTVKSHLGRLYEKLGVSDRAAAVAEAMRRGIVE